MSNQRRFALIGRGFGSDAFNESVQDVIGAILTDSAEINFTYTDATPSITAALIDGSVTFARLQNFDALSVLGRSANSSGVSDEIAAGANDRILRRTSDTLNFGQLTAGMFPNTVVPDAALSSNVPLLNASNTFTGNNVLSSTFPYLEWLATTQAANNKKWANYVSGVTWTQSALLDDGTPTEYLRVTRSSGAIDEVELNATTFDFNGNLDVSGTGTFGGALTFNNSPLTINDNSPSLVLNETDGTTDNKYWDFVAAVEQLRFRVGTDGGGGVSNWLTVDRTGTTVDEIELNATMLDFNGALDLSGNATIGGTLIVSGTAVAIDGSAGVDRDLNFRSGTSARWSWRTTSTAESGSNAGSDLAIIARSDAGSVLSTPFSIVRSSGAITIGSGGATPTHVLNTNTASTVGSAGGASAPPATPDGYIVININGTNQKIPYYAT